MQDISASAPLDVISAPVTAARTRRLVVIGDFCAGHPGGGSAASLETARTAWLSGERGPLAHDLPGDDSQRQKLAVVGGYLERLPLAAIRHGLCDEAEIWTFHGEGHAPSFTRDSLFLARRSFRADTPAPFASIDMLGHIAAFGPPDILCVWGLGVDAAIMQACASSAKIYNSIDAPALRIPPEISRHFDLVLTGAEWQSREVRDRHPSMATAIMPIGPEFASPETFFPIRIEKTYDLIYVAAAQAYKRHDILFDALTKLPRSIRALCVFGYGELGEALRGRARDLGISVDFVGPPGVAFPEVNRLMNTARIGVVCGIDDGAPAILTEYMLAGLPVLANAELRCGLQYITPHTGLSARADNFHTGIAELLHRHELDPRKEVIERWSWPVTMQKFAQALADAAPDNNLAVRRNLASN